MKTLVTMAPCHGFFKDGVDENPPILPENSKKTECQFHYGCSFMRFILNWQKAQAKKASASRHSCP
jgi:hypothetical protein